MINEEQLKPYLKVDADLITLNVWNKITRKKNGEPIERGKTPLFGNWTKRPKDTPQTIKKTQEGYNAGYRIGEEDLIIDVDPRNFSEGVDSLALLCKFLGVANLGEHCPTVLTGGGGFHYYTTKPADLCLREVDDKFKGIEFKTKGRQVVAAGSRHPNGKYYEWDDFSPELSKRPKAPKKLLKFLKREIPVNQSAGENSPINGEQLYSLLEQIPVEDYNDHSKWFSILCASHHGTGGAGIEEFLLWSLDDIDYCDDEDNIRSRWDSLGGKQLNYTINTLYKAVLVHGGTTSSVSAQQDFKEAIGEDSIEDDFDDFDDVIGSTDLDKSYEEGLATKMANELHDMSSEEDIIKAVRAAIQAGMIEQVKAFNTIQRKLKWTKVQLKDLINNIKDKIAEDLGRVLAEKTLELRFNKYKGLVYNTNGQFWAYNGKFWEPVTKPYVGRHITVVLDKLRKKIDVQVKENAIINEALGIIERLTATRKDVLRLREKPYPIINCQNGELWMKDDGTAELKPHRPKSFLLQVLNTDYVPGAECPLFDKSIRQIFQNYDDCEDIVRHIEEFMGYVLHPDKRPAHWWLFKGPGGDGKTTVMKILSALLGDAVQPDSIDRYKGGANGDSHATAELVGKLLIYDDDLDRNTILPDGTLKKLSEDGELTANPKGVGGFKFTKVCTVAMLSNGFPKTRDVTRGFRRRAMVVPFNRGFHEDGAILDLPDQIVKKELAGVMNRALQGLKRLREREKFQEPVSCRIAREAWLHESNPIALFISERIKVTTSVHDIVSLTEAYTSYTEWCLGYNVKRVGTKQEFRSAMEDMDIVFGHGTGNKSVFKAVKLLEGNRGVDEFEELVTDIDFDEEEEI